MLRDQEQVRLGMASHKGIPRRASSQKRSRVDIEFLGLSATVVVSEARVPTPVSFKLLPVERDPSSRGQALLLQEFLLQ